MNPCRVKVTLEEKRNYAIAHAAATGGKVYRSQMADADSHKCSGKVCSLCEGCGLLSGGRHCVYCNTKGIV